ncbi:hypothetical protein P153DRAFT_266877, partial [Dothidotthia symphoricarpi CBS 119687]
LPALSQRPTLYSGCCLALSAPLLDRLRTLLPSPPDLTLSIGSGYGLLEACLIAEPHFLRVVGVEVAPSSNIHLPAANHRSVYGTRSLEPLATEAVAWLFVYPRRVGLINEYIAEHGKGKLETIVWMGPNADWGDYKGCFAGWHVHVQSAAEIGGRAWELVAVAKRR